MLLQRDKPISRDDDDDDDEDNRQCVMDEMQLFIVQQCIPLRLEGH